MDITLRAEWLIIGGLATWAMGHGSIKTVGLAVAALGAYVYMQRDAYAPPAEVY